MSQAKKSKKSDIYLPCKDIKREKPDMTVSQEIAEEIGENYRTLPIFQRGLFEIACQNHYSLQTNEFLKCRWNQYKQHIEERIFAPFQFLDIRDYHFHNCRNQLAPSLSIHTRTNHRKSLKPGPSVDERGLRPIPQEFLMKRDGGGESKGRKKRQGKDVKKDKQKN